MSKYYSVFDDTKGIIRVKRKKYKYDKAKYEKKKQGEHLSKPAEDRKTWKPLEIGKNGEKWKNM